MKKPNIHFSPTPADAVADIQRLAQDIWPDAFREILTPEQIEYMMNWMYSTGQLQREINVEHIRYDRIFLGETCCGYVAYGPAKHSEVKLHKVYIRAERQRQGVGVSPFVWDSRRGSRRSHRRRKRQLSQGKSHLLRRRLW